MTKVVLTTAQTRDFNDKLLKVIKVQHVADVNHLSFVDDCSVVVAVGEAPQQVNECED